MTPPSKNLMRERLKSWDGWFLDVEVCQPQGAATGVVICGHAMMTDRRSLFRDPRPSLVRTLVDRGYTVIVPDLRGHGMSGPTPAHGGDWTYDDHVKDAGILLAYAASWSSGSPVALVGHSLFGHAAIAWLGRHPQSLQSVSAAVLLGVNLWHPRSWGADQDGVVRMAKSAVMRAAYMLGKSWGYLPVSRLVPRGMDEPTRYWSALYRCATEGGWRADDGFDYGAALRQVTCPVLHVVSEGDALYGNPDEAECFLQELPRRTFWRLGSRRCPEGLWSLRPDHMGLVTRRASEPLWEHVAQWLTTAMASEVDDA